MLGVAWALAASCLAGAALADEASPTAADPASGANKTFGVLSGDWQNPALLGDLGGLRPALAKYGITLQFFEEMETFGNVSGGVRQGFEGNGVTTGQLQWDTQPLLGLPGGLFNVSGFHIWGGQLNTSNVMAIQTVSGLEADPSLRLWELWYQQKFGDVFDVKIGEQSLDQEFMISQGASYFANAAMGWPALPASNLPAGGPVYPLATLGVRGRAKISDSLTFLAGAYSGTAIPLYSENSQLSNRNGLSFPLAGVLAIAELQFTYPAPDPSGKPAASGPLPGTYKIGAWYDSLDFDDQRVDGIGLPLASPLSDGAPAKKQGNFSLYAVADQTIWRDTDPNHYITAFVRPMFTTLQDRNLVSFSVNGGLTLHQPFAGRDNDVFGLGFGVVQVSNGAANADRDMRFYQPDVFTPVRSTETFFEATYQMQVLPSVQIQPDIQYVINPGAGIANPDKPWQKVENAWVLGLRANITF